MGTDMHYGATRKTFQFAAYLRKHMTPAEKFLWQHLRKSELGLRIRAQHPLSRYVVDFYCHEVRLVIEADGSIHTVEAVQLSDKEREEQLRFLGLHILRFDNDTIITNIKSVLATIQQTIEDLKAQMLTNTDGLSIHSHNHQQALYEVPFRGFRGKTEQIEVYSSRFNYEITLPT